MPSLPENHDAGKEVVRVPSRRRWFIYGACSVLAVVVATFGLWVTRSVSPPSPTVSDIPAGAPPPAVRPTPSESGATPPVSEPDFARAFPPPIRPTPGQSQAPRHGSEPNSVREYRPSPLPSRPASGQSEAPAPGPDSAPFPVFPWPPPRASASVVLPTEFLIKSTDSVSHFRDVDRKLAAALDSGDYSERSYYAVPDGFAVVTRLEQIDPDGTPKRSPDRWTSEVRPLAKFSLSAYFKALFKANPGFYRIIVFVVTSQSFSQSTTAVSREDSELWLSTGLNTLPAALGEREFTEGHRCTALIYEFKQPGSGVRARLDLPSDLPGRTHLEKASLWDALRK